MAANLGTGLTITFGTSSFSAEILGVSGDGAEIPVIDTTHQGTTNSRTKRFGDLVDEGTVDVEIHYDAGSQPPLGTSETITITFRTPDGMSSGATLSGTGGISSRNWENPLEDKISGGYTITWLDEVTSTAAA